MSVQHSLNKVISMETKQLMNFQKVVINVNMQKLSTVRLMSKNRQHLLNEGKLIKRKRHAKLKSKDMQNLLKKERILKREKHQRLMTKEKLNLQKEEKTTKRKKHQSLMSKDKLIMLKK